jgi:hypothetical protein
MEDKLRPAASIEGKDGGIEVVERLADGVTTGFPCFALCLGRNTCRRVLHEKGLFPNVHKASLSGDVMNTIT